MTVITICADLFYFYRLFYDFSMNKMGLKFYCIKFYVVVKFSVMLDIQHFLTITKEMILKLIVY